MPRCSTTRGPAVIGLLAFALVGGCAASAPGAAPRTSPAADLSWTLGAWEGVRIDGDDGTQAAQVRVVRPIVRGVGRTVELAVDLGGGRYYRGFALELPTEEPGVWERRYQNDVRPTVVRLRGEVTEVGSRWTRRTEGRWSRLEEERIGGDGWRRTMHVSNDSGATWQVLWTDELRRVAGPR